MIADWGFEDDESFLMVKGMKEWMVDGEPREIPPGDPAMLVDKRTGEISYVAHIVNLDGFREMSPVGPVPTDRR